MLWSDLRIGKTVFGKPSCRLALFEFSSVGGAGRVDGVSTASTKSIGYEVFNIDVLSKLAPAKVGLKEKSGFLDLENRGFQHRHGTRRRNCQDWSGRQGRNQWTRNKGLCSSGQGNSKEWQARADHSPQRQVHTHRGQCGTVLHGSRVWLAHNALSLLTAGEPWMPAVGKSCAPRSHGEPCPLLGKVHLSLCLLQLDTFCNARYAAVLEWAKHTAAISNLS